MPKFIVECRPGTQVHAGTAILATVEENGKAVIDCTEEQAKAIARCHDIKPFKAARAAASE